MRRLALSAAAALASVAGCGEAATTMDTPTTSEAPTTTGPSPATEAAINQADLPWRITADASLDTETWARLRSSANWVEFYPTLHETVRAVDFAGFANIVGIEAGASIGDVEPPGEAIETVTLTMQIVDVLTGPADLSMLRLRMEVTGLAAGEEMAAILTPLEMSGTVFVALHELGNGDYRIINEHSIWAIAPSGAGIVPVLTTSDALSWKDFIDGYGDVGSMTELHERIAGAA